MISLNQTLEYINACRALNVEVKARTEDEMIHLIDSAPHGEHRDKLLNLLQYPDTAGAYMELLRIHIGSRAIGALSRHHPCAMVNVRNMSIMLHSYVVPLNAHLAAQPYGLGNLSKWGAFIDVADEVHTRVDDKNLLDKVYHETHLYRILSLHEYMDTFDAQVTKDITRPFKRLANGWDYARAY